MSHVLKYGGQYFRVDITEVVNADDPDKAVHVGWCSDAFKELKDTPKHAVSQFIAGPPLRTYDDALRHAYDWIKTDWDARQVRRVKRAPGIDETVGAMYSVWLYNGDASTGFDFREFGEAKAFAKAAEKSASITKIVITDNESPQYLTLWEKSQV